MIVQKLFVLGTGGAVLVSGMMGCSYISASGDWPPTEDAPVARAAHYQQLASSTSPLRKNTVSNTALPGPAKPRGFDSSPPPVVPNHVIEDVSKSRSVPLQIPPTTVVTSAPIVSSSVVSSPTVVSHDLAVGALGAGSGLPPARTAMTDDQSKFEPVAENTDETPPKKRVAEAPVAKDKPAKHEVEAIARKPETAEVNMDTPNEDVTAVVLEDPEAGMSETLPVAKAAGHGTKKVETTEKIETITPARAEILTVAAPTKLTEVEPQEALVVPSSGLPVAVAPTSNVVGGDCGKAQDESKRAQSAVSDADRLFYFRRALRLCPTESKYHLEIGKIYAGLGRVVDAEHEFRQVLESDPENAEAKAQLTKIEEAERR